MSDLKPDELDNLPAYVKNLGEITHLVKYASKRFKDAKSQVNYLNFEWYIHAMRLVLSHCIFESFITQTIDVICKVKPNVINTLEGFKTAQIDGIDESQLQKYITKVHKKIGGKSIHGRLKFLRENCQLQAILDNKRKEMILFLEQIRHIIVHQSGIIDKQFFDRLRDTRFNEKFIEQKVGEQIKIDKLIIDAQCHIYSMFIVELFIEICQKYLGIKI